MCSVGVEARAALAAELAGRRRTRRAAARARSCVVAEVALRASRGWPWSCRGRRDRPAPAGPSGSWRRASCRCRCRRRWRRLRRARCAASLIIGKRMRLTTNPGESVTVIGVLPTVSANARAVATVASDVSSPRTTSTSAMAGTGLKKWMPTNRSGFGTKVAEHGHREARGVGGDDRVGTKRRGGGLEQAPLDRERLGRRLDEQVGVGAGRDVEAGRDARQCGVARRPAPGAPFSTARPSCLSMPAMPLAMNSSAMSIMTACSPAWAATWTMPAPICPAPATSSFWTFTTFLLGRRRSTAGGTRNPGPRSLSVAAADRGCGAGFRPTLCYYSAC